jgi:hypothetical protein
MKSLFSFLLFLSSLTAFSQNNEENLILFQGGYWIPADSCTLAVNRKYGFTAVATEVDLPPVGRKARHNKRVEKKLELINGAEWRSRYDEELKRCDYYYDLQLKSLRERKPQLTYYYVGDGCPSCNDEHPEKVFGFVIECVGCITNDSIKKHNSFVINQLDVVYGPGWTLNYVNSYCDNIPFKEEK